jgi:isopentenyl-diphosphate delta-isomerase
MPLTTKTRKSDHIKICSEKDVSFKEKTTLLECVYSQYKALPEISLNDVNLSTTFLGKQFSFPIMVSAITGGATVSKKINKDIATACQSLGIGMGLGSMRAMLQHPSLAETYFVRDVAPDIFLAGNIGATQLKEYSVEQIGEALDAIEADALAIHANAAQEAVQPEGNIDFSGLISKIDEIAARLGRPVYVKEVGHGIGFETAVMLRETKISAVDIQGAGGTSWTAVDSLRHKKGFGSIFSEFGIPTAVSLIETKNALQNTNKKIIASGGIRNGIDAAKCIVMGADMVGLAMPVLKAQQEKGAKGVEALLSNFINELEITSFLLGAKNLGELKKQNFIVTGKLKEWLNQ